MKNFHSKKTLTIRDRVYGKIEISNKVIIELIGSSPMQRLKHVGQTGAVAFIEPGRDITRFEHSVGVWFLLKKYGASLEEQIAGLLHDTPHTAFSHVADVVFPNENNTFHEQFMERVIWNSEVPEILKKYKIDTKYILDKSRFHLLDAELPDLSADRIDYFLRDTRPDLLFPQSLVKQFLAGIFVKNEKFYFKDRSLASLYAILFMNAGRLLWLDPNSHGSYYVLANAIKRAFEIQAITMDDFFGTDQYLFEKIKNLDDEIINQAIKKLSPETKFVYSTDEKAEFSGANKPRIVDPLVEQDGEFIRVSDLSPHLKEMFEHYKQSYKYLSVTSL